MATAEAGVCNRALGRIGQTQFIADLADKNTIARTCSVYYADSRDAVLEARPWPFATKRAALAAATGKEREGWGFAYPLPADLLSTQYIHNPAVMAIPDSLVDVSDADTLQIQQTVDIAIPFALELDDQLGEILLTNQATPTLVYTAQVTAVSRFSSLFVDALAWLLASDLALAIAKKPNVATACLQEYERALARAGARAFNQQKRSPRPASVYERNR